jgi:hypothetical protein
MHPHEKDCDKESSGKLVSDHIKPSVVYAIAGINGNPVDPAKNPSGVVGLDQRASESVDVTIVVACNDHDSPLVSDVYIPPLKKPTNWTCT